MVVTTGMKKKKKKEKKKTEFQQTNWLVIPAEPLSFTHSLTSSITTTTMQ